MLETNRWPLAHLHESRLVSTKAVLDRTASSFGLPFSQAPLLFSSPREGGIQHAQKTIMQLRTPPGELCGWPFEGDDRNFAGRLLLILAIRGKYFYCPLKRLFSLIAGENAGGGSKFLTANFDRNFRVGQQVEIPIRMFRMPSFCFLSRISVCASILVPGELIS